MAIEAEDAEWQRMRQRRLSPPPPDPDEKEEAVQQSGWMRVSSLVKQTSTHRRASTTALGTRTPISTARLHSRQSARASLLFRRLRTRTLLGLMRPPVR